MLTAVDFQYSNDIKVVNRQQYEAHLRLYKGYIDKINEIDKILKGDAKREEANATFSYYRECKRGETYALDGVILHELYFENLGGDRCDINPRSKKQIDICFGDYDFWRKDFIATAKASRGWAVLSYDQRSFRYRNISLDSHDLGNIAYSAAILVLDVYEHAYFMQYGTDKDKYIDAFMDNINWDVVEKRMCM